MCRSDKQIYISFLFTSKRMDTLFSFSTFPLDGKTILLRVDYNVPVENGTVADNTRIMESLPTIQFLQEKNCKIIILTHFGRPEGKPIPEFRTDPLAKELQTFLPETSIIKLDNCIGPEVKERIQQGKPNELFFLENVRFYKEEEENNPAFAHSLASLAEVYVNDAFANCHRKHASMHAITQFLPSLPGIFLEKELYHLDKALHPLHPAVWIMGGAKLDKIDLLQQALDTADYILMGGALPFTFLKAQGIDVGLSKIDADSIPIAQEILKSSHGKKLIFPADYVVTETFAPRALTAIVPFNGIQPNQMALDLGPATIELFKQYLRKAHTIVWNGPLGYYEWAAFATGTKEIGRFIGKLTAVSICGGGETADAIYKFNLQHEITHVSTGGGASLTYLAGKPLPAIEALKENYKMFKGKM